MYTTSGGLSETQRERICSLIFGPECSIIFTSGYSFSKSAKTSFHHESPYPPTKYCISRSPDILPSEVSVSLLLLFVLSLLLDRKSTRLNSSHVAISYAVFCLKKKTKTKAS